MQMKTNKNGVKLLAAIAVFAMVFAGLAVVVSDNTDAVGVQAPENGDELINALDQNAIDAAKTAGKFTGTATIDTDASPKTLTLNNYSGLGFMSTEALKIIVKGTNTITMERPSDETGFAAIYIKTGDLTIVDYDNDTTTEDSLSITVNGKSVDDKLSAAKTYGIYLESSGALEVTKVKFNMTVSTADNLAFAFQGCGSKNITFTNVTGSISGGNRALQVQSNSDVKFNACNMTLTGGEKAIQAKYTGSEVQLVNSSEIELKLSDTLLNSGVNDRFGGKLTALSVDETSTLETQGLRILGEVSLAPSGTVIVSGGYEQGSPEVNYVAGLFLDNCDNEITAGVGTTALGFNVTEDAQVSGIKATGKSDVTTISTIGSGSTLDDEVKNAIGTTTGGSSLIIIDSGITDTSLKISDLKGKDLVLDMGSNNNITKVDITIAKDDNLVIKNIDAATTVTITNGSNQASISGIANVAVKYGSVEVYVLDSVTSEQTITAVGDVLIEANITKNDTAGTLNVVVPNGKEANIDISGIRLSHANAVLNLKGGNVFSETEISNAGTINFEGAKIDGTLTVAGGKVQGTIAGGNLAVKGSVSMSAALTVKSDGKLTVTKDSTFAAGSNDLKNEGTINVYGTITADSDGSKITNDGKIILLDKGANIPKSMKGTGTVDTSSIASYAELSGEIKTVTKYGVYQTVTIIGDTNFVAGTQIYIEGTLIINKGVTLTIEDGAQLAIVGSLATLENNGTIVVESDVTAAPTGGEATGAGGFFIKNSQVVNNGAIVVECTDGEHVSTAVVAAISNNANFLNNGIITVAEDNKVTIEGSSVVNATDAEILVNGEITGTIKNAGIVTVNGAIGTITNTAAGAQIVVIKSTAAFIINDDGITKYSTATFTTNNSISTDAPAGDVKGVGGFIVTSEINKVGTDYVKSLVIAGAMDVTKTQAEVTAHEINLSGNILIKDELSLSKDVELTGGDLTVSGAVTALEGSNINTSSLTVTGTVVAGSTDITVTGTVNAAMYKVMVISPASTTYTYTTIENAVQRASEAGVKDITVEGTISIIKDLEIPAGIYVKQDGGTITIGSDDVTDVTVTVKEGANISQTSALGTIVVKGTLFIEDKATGIKKNTAVESVVKAETDKAIRYTNLASALASVGSDPVTIKLNDDADITSDVTIPSNVTIEMNDSKLAVQGAKLTIDGTLLVDNNTNYTVGDKTVGDITKKGSVVLNGYIVSVDQMNYSATNAKTPAGAYYTVGSKFYITSVANAPAVIADAAERTVNIYGTNSIESLSFIGTSDAALTVNINGDLTVQTLTVDNTTVSIANGVKVNGKVANTAGSIAFTDAVTGAKTKIVSSEKDGKDVLTVSEGNVKAVEGKEKTYALVFDGDVTVKKLTITTPVVTGSHLHAAVIDGNVTVTGSDNNFGDVLVNGTLVADNGVTINASNIEVLGTLEASKPTETKPTAGQVSVTGDVYVGTESKNTGAAASIIGAISAKTIYVVDGSSVDETTIADMKYTKYIVEGALWMTAYTDDVVNSEKISAVKKAPVEDAKFTGTWTKDAAFKVDIVDEKVGTVTDVYAKITYEIYKVTVIGDNGIGTISIDGNLLVKGIDGENVFTFVDSDTLLKAGAHEINYELKDGYEGTIKIKVDGTEISGKTFTLSGTPKSTENTVSVVIDISGSVQKDPVTPVEPTQPTEKDDGMGITDYLLIVLVILAAILVVVVAIRMMRS